MSIKVKGQLNPRCPRPLDGSPFLRTDVVKYERIGIVRIDYLALTNGILRRNAKKGRAIFFGKGQESDGRLFARRFSFELQNIVVDHEDLRAIYRTDSAKKQDFFGCTDTLCTDRADILSRA